MTWEYQNLAVGDGANILRANLSLHLYIFFSLMNFQFGYSYIGYKHDISSSIINKENLSLSKY